MNLLIDYRKVWILSLVSAVLVFQGGSANGLLLPIIASFLLWVMNDTKLLGTYTNSTFANLLGSLIIGITIILGLKGIITAFI